MTCMRCGAPMYSVVGPNGAKATCNGCCQHIDCAQCSKCKDTKCLGCYNKAVTRLGKPTEIRLEPIVPADQEI